MRDDDEHALGAGGSAPRMEADERGQPMNNDDGRRTIWWGAAVFLAALAVLPVRVIIPDTVPTPVAWGIGIVVSLLVVVLLRHRIRWPSAPDRERDEQQGA